MCEILWNPIRNKKDVRIERSATLLVIEALLVAIAVAVMLVNPMLAKVVPSIAAASLIVGAFVLVLFCGVYTAYVLDLILRVLVNKARYTEAFAVITNSFLALSIGILVASVLSYIPFAGPALAYIVIVPLAALSYALMFKLIKTLFGTDMITAFVAVTVLWAVLGISIYAVLGLSAAQFSTQVGSLQTLLKTGISKLF